MDCTHRKLKLSATGVCCADCGAPHVPAEPEPEPEPIPRPPRVVRARPVAPPVTLSPAMIEAGKWFANVLCGAPTDRAALAHEIATLPAEVQTHVRRMIRDATRGK